MKNEKTLTENELELLNEEFQKGVGHAFPSKWFLESKFDKVLGFDAYVTTFTFQENDDYGDWGDAYYWDTGYECEEGCEIILKVVLEQESDSSWNYVRKVREIEFE